jgi:copper chaperone CopZ
LTFQTLEGLFCERLNSDHSDRTLPVTTAAAAPDSAEAPRTGAVQTLTVPIEGMHCASCIGRVERALDGVPGVLEAWVNPASERAEVRLDPDVATAAEVVEAADRAGYSAPTTTVELTISGMSCAACVARVEKVLASVLGVVDVIGR